MKFACAFLIAVFALISPLFAGSMNVSALHPLMADLAREVGGERVHVFDLVGEGGDPHRFEPRPSDLRNMQSSALILAAGKGLENYLDRIRQTIPDVPMVEVGHTLPSLTVGKDEVYTCCPHHAHEGALDPHWWQGVDNMRRAARVVADALAEVDPDGEEHYRTRATAYARELAELKSWVRRELARVPRNQRKLVTAHNAFGYFANEFGFEVIAVAGLNKEQENAPQELARTIESVRESGVPAIFPEYGANQKTLESIARSTGTKLGTPLIADGNGAGENATFKGMIHHNVNAITEALVSN